MTIAGFLPYWFRFAQCIHKYNDSQTLPHILNALKYFSKLIPPFIVCFLHQAKHVDGEGFALYLTFNTIATLYCLIWDVRMDWGLFRSSGPGTWLLRDKIIYNPKFYYFAMITNLFLRFFWILTII